MNLFRSLLPGEIPENLKGQGELQILRERALQLLYLVATFFGLFMYSVAVMRFLYTRNVFAIVLTTLIYGALIIFLVNRRASYLWRSLLLFFSLDAIGLWFMTTGQSPMLPAIIFLGIVVMAVVLLDRQFGIGFFALGLLSLFVFSSGYTITLIERLRVSVIYTMVSLLSIVLLSQIVNGLQKSLNQQSLLARTLDSERRGLEKRIESRTNDLSRRLEQIRTAAEISGSISSILNLQELLQKVVELLTERNNLYYSGVFLIDETGKFALLQAGSGDAGYAMVNAGHRLEIGGSSMIGWTIANRKPRIALDVGNEPVRFNNPHLPLTRSEIAIPLVNRSVVLGALTIQSVEPNAFDQDDILIFQGVADSLASAIQTARLFAQNQRDLEEIRALNQRYLQNAWNETIETYGSLSFAYENPNAVSFASQSGRLQIPINLREQIIGQVTVETNNPSLSPQEMAIVEAIVTQTALALENARLIEETQRKAAQEEQVNRITAEFARAVNIDEILKTTIKELGKLPAVNEASIVLNPTDSLPDQFKPAIGNNNNGHGVERAL